MEKEQLLGTTFTCEQVVTPDMTAASAVPGTPNVFGTPVLVALVEKTCFMCMDQASGEGEASLFTDTCRYESNLYGKGRKSG